MDNTGTNADANRTRAVRALVASVHPGAELIAAAPLGDDSAGEDTTAKAAGYGAPLKLSVRLPDGSTDEWVLRTASANEFGHEWRCDRAAEMLLAYDTFATIPDHVQAVDVGALARDGTSLISLRGAGEFYLLTDYRRGTLYADDLRQIAAAGRVTERDRDRCRALARWLAELHVERDEESSVYPRTVRDVVGSGEGIFGIADGYPSNTPGADPERLRAIEHRCLDERWRLKKRRDRLCRIHGDFHPFNILFDGDQIGVLDASRGSVGDPANDVACLAINYVFFAVSNPASWRGALRGLWYSFWEEYGAQRRDPELAASVPLYLTWRALVLCNPAWYPNLPTPFRERILRLAETTLDRGSFAPADAESVFAGQA